jgi:hypothetical protein
MGTIQSFWCPTCGAHVAPDRVTTVGTRHWHDLRVKEDRDGNLRVKPHEVTPAHEQTDCPF